MSRTARFARLLGLLLVLGALTQCRSLAYYGQAIRGGAGVILARQPIDKLLADPGVDGALKERLRFVLEVRTFASEELGLPDNRSYRTYADLDRPYAVWNVVAAPELSVEPLVWCFPIAGCVSYRGYFRRPAAERFAQRLEKDGYDTEVGGVAAYSTLGWFADPVLNTFIDLPDAELAGLIFHELAHQVAYAAGDTTFNESFATVVELEGVRRWMENDNRGQEAAIYREEQGRQEAVMRLMLEYRGRLATIYGTAEPEAEKREAKAETLAELRAAYRELVASWGGSTRYDGWFGDGLDNARLATVGAYFELVPELEALLQSEGSDLERFYARIAALSELTPEARRVALGAAR